VTVFGPISWDGTIDDAVALLQPLVAAQPPFVMSLEGVSTFLPDSPTCFVVVRTPGPFVDLHDAIARRFPSKEVWPYVPHATISEYLSVEDTAALVRTLEASAPCYEYRVDRLTLLRQTKGGVWEPAWVLPLHGSE
jgi:2'-5' RNA ligase